MVLSAGLNGFGRFGLNLMRAWLDEDDPSYGIRYINDPKLTPGHISQIMHTDRYVQFHDCNIRVEESGFCITNKRGEHHIGCSTATAFHIPWRGEPELFLECSGKNTEGRVAWCAPLIFGETRALITSATMWDADATLLWKFNHETFRPQEHRIVSYGSCTVNAYIPLAAFLHQQFAIKSSRVHVIHGVPEYQLREFNTIKRRPCSLERVAHDLLPILDEQSNFKVFYDLVPYSGPSVMDMEFTFHRSPSRKELLKVLNIGMSGHSTSALRGLYDFVSTDIGPEPHVGSAFNAVIVENDVSVQGETVFLHCYFYNDGAYRYHDVVSHIARQLVH